MFDPKEDEFVKAGILNPLGDGEEDGMLEVEGEWEWKEKHSLFRWVSFPHVAKSDALVDSKIPNL